MKLSRGHVDSLKLPEKSIPVSAGVALQEAWTRDKAAAPRRARLEELIEFLPKLEGMGEPIARELAEAVAKCVHEGGDLFAHLGLRARRGKRNEAPHNIVAKLRAAKAPGTLVLRQQVEPSEKVAGLASVIRQHQDE